MNCFQPRSVRRVLLRSSGRRARKTQGEAAAAVPLRAGQQKAALMRVFLIGMAYVQIRKKPASEKHKSDAGFFIKF